MLGILMIFLAFRTSQIYSFLNCYIVECLYTNSNVIISDYFTIYTFIIIIVTISIITSIFSLFYVKNKPRMFYIVSIVAYLYVLIVYFIYLFV